MESGLALLSPRLLNDEISSVIADLESKSTIVLPPLYRVFIENFNLGKIKREYYQYKEDLWAFTGYRFMPRPEIDIMDFVAPEDCFEGYLENEDGVIENKLFNLASVGRFSGGLFVGTDGKFLDKIVLDTDRDGEARFEIISSDIFQFIKGIESFVIDEEHRPYKMKLSMLYKNWGEDFWRVRE